MTLVFWIFSYNRGEFLQNCVASIEQCAPADSILRIFDDNSSDADTQILLSRLAEKYEVYFPEPRKNGSNKHGGLYANMQAAFQRCGADDLVCFLQDDTQLVRKIDAQEVAQLGKWLDASAPCFVQGAFMRGSNKSKDARRTRFDADKNVYFVDRLNNSAGAFYSDICIFSVKQLHKVQWRFIPRESCNEQVARKKLQQMAYWRDPFIAWLPYVPAFRGKTQTLALRWAQKTRRCGFYPLQILSHEQDARFRNRSNEELPYAEDFLDASIELPKPWIGYPLQGKRWLKILNSAELKLRKWLL